MRTSKSLIIFISLFLGFFSVSAQSFEGYTLSETLDGVSLYYKVTEYGISFKVKNDRDKMVHVRIYNVSSNWTDGMNRTKDVDITYIPAGETRAGSYGHSDNYSKMTGSWSFGNWRWSEDENDF